MNRRHVDDVPFDVIFNPILDGFTASEEGSCQVRIDDRLPVIQ